MKSNIFKNFNYNRLYFMHIPKTAGTFVKEYFKNYLDSNDIYHGFCVDNIFSKSNINNVKDTYKFQNYLNDFSEDKIFTFTTFRNPYDLLCSYYMHHKQNKYIQDGWLNCNSYHNFKNFKDFVLSYCDPNFDWHIKILQNFLLSQIFDKDGNCVPKIIIPYESLNISLNFFKQNLHNKFLFKKNSRNLKFRKFIKYQIKLLLNNNNSQKRSIRISNRKENDFRYYYDNEMVDLLSKKCKRELVLFGYNFDKNDFNKSLTNFENYYFTTQSINYNLSKNILNVNGIKI